MADELIDILNEDLTFQKTYLKSYAHMHGLLHASVHIWFYNNNAEILLQKRANSKVAFPDLWDISVAGHISSGEDNYEAAIREVKEEIGIDISSKDLINIGLFKEYFEHTSEFKDNEVHHLFLCKLKFGIEQLNILEEELSEIKLISIGDFHEELSSINTKKYVPHQGEYYKIIFSEISKRL